VWSKSHINISYEELEKNARLSARENGSAVSLINGGDKGPT
jgi:hypothetical protein